MLTFSVKHPVKDLLRIIQICSVLVKENIELLDHTDFYNIQSYCKKLRSKKESYSYRAIRHRSEVAIVVNINELRSLEKLFDLNNEYFNLSDNIRETLIFTSILQEYRKFQLNHIYEPFTDG
jgi:hypothetical protein